MPPALINIITKTSTSSLYVFYLKDKSLPDVLLTLCSWIQLSTAPPLSVAADDNRHLKIFCNALITYLFFTWDGIYDFSEQCTGVGTQNTDGISQLLGHSRGIKMLFWILSVKPFLVALCAFYDNRPLPQELKRCISQLNLFLVDILKRFLYSE